jgi:leucyl-tRNA---protein transferase
MSSLPPLEETFCCNEMPESGMDALWAQGWRHQGRIFFRYTHTTMEDVEHRITPVRLELEHFQPSKSQRRTLRKNEDLRWEVQRTHIDDPMREMFETHKQRFVENVPHQLEDFLGERPGTHPCMNVSVKAFLDDQMIAVSFMDVGHHATSSVYAMFDPNHHRRGLGIMTLLKEIEVSQHAGKRYLYQGFATSKPSIYSYKTQFSGLQRFDWNSGNWHFWDPIVEPDPCGR